MNELEVWTLRVVVVTQALIVLWSIFHILESH